jgi:hypothetical protein
MSGESASKRWTAVDRPPGRSNSTSPVRWRCISFAHSGRLQSCPVAVDEFEPASSVLRQSQWKREFNKNGYRLLHSGRPQANAPAIRSGARLQLELRTFSSNRHAHRHHPCAAPARCGACADERRIVAGDEGLVRTRNAHFYKSLAPVDSWLRNPPCVLRRANRARIRAVDSISYK